MTTQKFNKQCDELREVIINGRRRSSGTDHFKVAYLNRTRYIYNTVAHNIIYKERVGRSGQIGVQYRPTSIYAEVMRAAAVQIPGSRVTASPNMRRHVRDVQLQIGT